MKTKLLIISSVILLLVSCIKIEKRNGIYQEAIPHGENTMYYYEDGELIVPKNSGLLDIDHARKAIIYDSCFYRPISTKLDANHSIKIFFKQGIQNVGTIEMQNIPQPSSDDCNLYTNNFALLKNHTTRAQSGSVNITYLSADKRKFKGTFEMTLYDDNGNTKNITDGHFNINLNTLNQQ